MIAGVTASNLVELLRRRADVNPDAMAVVYLSDGEEVKQQITFGELDLKARAIAARVQGLGARGECVILVHTPGLEFLSAFFGCLYADAIPVPLPLPHSKGTVAQFPAIVADLDARILMTTATTMTRLRRMELTGVDALIALTTEDTQPELARAWRAFTPSGAATAYLQYTSGSTANRKGVIISHDNVIAHLLGMAERFGHHQDSVSVNWLPHTHDLGLVSGILQPLFHGHLNVLMSPNAFVQQPIRWLDAISRFRGTYSNSPNFGYDQCVRRTTPEQRARLDLSSWEVALNGAEPVHQRTIDEFISMFEPCGFRRATMYPAYGLAEATLMVSGFVKESAGATLQVDADALARDRIVESTGEGSRTLVGCGLAMPHTTIRIVDPLTCEESADDRVGEIWARGPGITGGYWRRPEENEQTFRGRLAGGAHDDEVYLRTGDLGFLRSGVLYITGRWKDLVIIRGANHYPQDIEWTIERSHPAFRPGCGGAFSLDGDDGEQLIVAYEVEREHLRTAEPDELARVARRAVAEEHDLHLHTLVLLKTGTVPRTTSGKIQRRKCRSDFLGGELAEIWRSTDTAPVVDVQVPPADDSSPRSAQRPVDDLVAWLRDYADECINSRLMDERRSIAPHVILDFGNRGILGLQVPPDLGGRGFGFADTLKVIEQLGAIDQTLTMMAIVHNSLGIWPILQHAAPALKADLLPKLASGRELVAFAITEPVAGSYPQAIASRALPDGTDAWMLHGQKSWSGTAGWASVINVFAQNVGVEGTVQGLSGFVVPRGTRGLRVGPEALTLGVRGMVQNTVYLEGARVTREQCLGEIGGGMKVAQDAMLQGRLAIGAGCVGGMKRSLQLLLRYASARTVSTGRLLENPVLLDRAATLTAALSGLESLVYDVARRLDGGQDVPPEALIVCKAAGSEWLWRAADDLVQFLGGRGYIETNIAAQLLRDARVTRILEGPTEALGMYLGSRVVHDGTPLHRFVSEGLGAPDISARLSRAAAEIVDRCAAGHRRGDDADARRWAYALVGQVAMDAVLLAATPASHRGRAEQRFETSIGAALEKATRGSGVTASELEAMIDGYAVSIGDIEQSLPGEDHALDDMLRRGADARAVARPPVQSADATPIVTPAPPAPIPEIAAPPAADATAVERFIVQRIAAALKIRETAIDPNRSFFDYGLDSVTTVMLTASLEESFGVECNPELVYEIPVIRRFAAHVAGRRASRCA
jgi:acyl-CoA synthetase (AMP-forming)/AMP-acid ligase II/alkylation response protein AidB-like acyl-CoA dehydrogenase/acyl carrier protein